MAGEPRAATPVEAMRQALAELGDAPDADLAAFLERRHGLTIDARFVPVLKASARGLEQLEQARKAAREAVEKAPREPPADRPGG